MIDFISETDFELENQDLITSWISKIIDQHDFLLGDITYVFCDDETLHKINVEHLQHDTLTDIISFDYTIGKQLHGEIYISIERVLDNAKDFNVSFENELLRVLIHGVLHFMNFKDKTDLQKTAMRSMENEAIKNYYEQL